MSTRTRSQVESEIRETLGLVPGFFDAIPDHLFEAEWMIFKNFELGETLIPGKYKQLMGIALHSETKCQYCILFHTEAAKLFGATDEEIEEAVHYAKNSLGWSAYLNGMQTDRAQFEQELERVGQHLASQEAAMAS